MRRSQEDLLQTKLRSLLPNAPVRAWLQGGMLRLAPISLEVR
jgi:hypothetical protein